ncbi:MAG: stage III sporulation protein AE [Clostridia bacterium]|nr:stage III sporulation protein AE [Clostridia bacterium]
MINTVLLRTPTVRHSHSPALKVSVCILLLLISLIITYIKPAQSYAQHDQQTTEQYQQQLDDQIDEQVDKLDLSLLDAFYRSVGDEDSIYGGGIVDMLKSILDGSLVVDEGTFLTYIGNNLLSSMLGTISSLSIVIVVAVLIGVVANKDYADNKSRGEIIYLACYCLIISVVLVSVINLADITRNTIYSIKTLINVLMPILLTLMSAIGASSSVTAYQPSVALLSSGIIELFCIVILPLCLLAIVFSVVSNISENIRLDKISSFIHKLSTTMIGIVFSIFTSFLTIKGITASATDNISIRAVKYATRNYIPVVGGYLAEGFDFIIASSVLIKNAFGIIGLIILLTIVVKPVLKVLLYSLALSLVAGFIEPVTDKRVVAFLSSTSKNLTILYVSVLAITFMLFIIILLVMCTANSL